MYCSFGGQAKAHDPKGSLIMSVSCFDTFDLNCMNRMNEKAYSRAEEKRFGM